MPCKTRLLSKFSKNKKQKYRGCCKTSGLQQLPRKTVWRVWSRSVRGPAHIELGLPNQDASLVYASEEYTLAVVADGVGSKPHADTGSAMACQAVKDAAVMYSKNTAMTDQEFAALIYENWRRLILPFSPAECSTTCLFALRYGGTIFLGQTGDGLAVYYTAEDGRCSRIIEDKQDLFSNMTSTALSGSNNVGAWRFARYGEKPNSMVVLCSDGISETIESESIPLFIQRIYHFSRANTNEQCEKDAEQWLARWPAPGHYDDKTIAVLFSGGR